MPGTLDPLASGVLLILVNEATKIADYLQIPDKEYVAEIRLGIRTDTDDITGRVLEEKPVAGLTGNRSCRFWRSFWARLSRSRRRFRR